MKTLLALTAATLVASTGFAQSAPPGAQPPAPSKAYVEGVAQSAFGNVTSQSFGGEAGVTVAPQLQVFVDAGKVRDAATNDLGTHAQQFAQGLAATQSAVSFHVKQPVTFGLAGLKYVIPVDSKLEPYVLGGGGVAKVSKDVTFSVGGNDVTNNLASYNAVLGSDLSGAETKAMLTVGAGVTWPAWQHLVVDFQYRYGRIFTTVQGLNVSRAGIGIGVRF